MPFLFAIDAAYFFIAAVGGRSPPPPVASPGTSASPGTVNLMAAGERLSPIAFVNSPLKKASLTGFHATAKHIAAKAVSLSSETMRTI